MEQGWKRRWCSESAFKHLQLWRAFSGQLSTKRQSQVFILNLADIYNHSWIFTYIIYCGVAMTTGDTINRVQLSIKDTHWEFNGGHCSVRSVSQKSNGGGGTVWLHLAEWEGDVIHQKQVTATAKCWKDIQSLPYLWWRVGAKETAATFLKNKLLQKGCKKTLCMPLKYQNQMLIFSTK